MKLHLKMFSLITIITLCFLIFPATSDLLRSPVQTHEHLPMDFLDFTNQLEKLQEKMLQQDGAITKLASLVSMQSEEIAVLKNSKLEENLRVSLLEKSLYDLKISNMKERAKVVMLEDSVKNLERLNKIQDQTIAELQVVANTYNGAKRPAVYKGESSVKRTSLGVGKPKGLKATSVKASTSGKNGNREVQPISPTSANTSAPAETVHVAPRSDDDNPLVASLAHVTQRVDIMAAKMAALETSQQAKIAALETSQQTKIAALETSVADAATSMFVRWGNDGCGSHAETVYQGWVGGSYYGHSGAAANYLCLPRNPVFSTMPRPGYVDARLYGGEYQTGVTATTNKDPLCCVCRSRLPTTLMLPSTNVCPSGWTKQYSGHLMAGANDHAAASEYICVDDAMKIAVHSDKDENGKLLYYVSTRCGSLPCSPYQNDKIVTCVVCSK